MGNWTPRELIAACRNLGSELEPDPDSEARVRIVSRPGADGEEAEGIPQEIRDAIAARRDDVLEALRREMRDRMIRLVERTRMPSESATALHSEAISIAEANADQAVRDYLGGSRTRLEAFRAIDALERVLLAQRALESRLARAKGKR